MEKEERKELLWLYRKIVSGLIGPDMWKYIAHKDQNNANMYVYDHGRRIDK